MLKIRNLDSTDLFRVFKLALLPIFFATTLSNFLDQIINQKIELLLKSPNGLSSSIWLYALASLLLSFLTPIFKLSFTTFALQSVWPKRKSFLSFLNEKFELTLLETINSVGKSFLWGLLFIIPGIVKYFYYILVPFITLLSPAYIRGERNALQYSAYIFKKHWLIYSLLIFIFGFLFPIIFSTLFDEYLVFQLHIKTALALSFFDSMMTLMFHMLVLYYFMISLCESEPESFYFFDSQFEVNKNLLFATQSTEDSPSSNNPKEF